MKRKVTKTSGEASPRRFLDDDEGGSPNQGDEGESQIGFETAGNRHHLVFLFIMLNVRWHL